MDTPTTNSMEKDGRPDTWVSSKDAFGTKEDLRIPAFSERTPYVPDIDTSYQFDPIASLAIAIGFACNQRVLLYGLHGTGKSTHIEQVAARLNWPCMRINMDGHITRMDLLGRDTIKIENGKQITKYENGIIPYVLQKPIALVLDEYDAMRPEVLFVMQRLLEKNGGVTMFHSGEYIKPHSNFRIFATANTVGLGDSNGMYYGTQYINHGQLDRWSVVYQMEYMSFQQELDLLLRKFPELSSGDKRETVKSMVRLAGEIRNAFKQEKLSVVMSPRTVIAWIENLQYLNNDICLAFELSFLNRCEGEERILASELFHKCFGLETSSSIHKVCIG